MKRKKKYKCQLCEKSFTHKCFLKKHVETRHEGKIPEKYPCHICGGKLANKASLNQHIKGVHEGMRIKPHPCLICYKRFEKSESLRHHVETVHEKINNCMLYLQQNVCNKRKLKGTCFKST